MYTPSYFTEHRPEELQRIIEAHPFAALVVNGANGPDACHLPFEFDAHSGSQGVLRAHIARENPLWQEYGDNTPVLVIFQGADSYISPNWYPSKHEFHRQVPTWNYQVVHVHGKLRVHHDRKFLLAQVGRLTRTHENRAGGEKPWRMADAEKSYIDELLAGIVGIEIEVERISGTSKLNQNKDRRDRENVISELHKRQQDEMSDAMRRTPGTGRQDD